MKTITLPILFFVIILTGQAQNNQPKIEQVEKKLIIDSVISILNRAYVFPDVAKKMTDNIKLNFESGNYNPIEDPKNFAEKLTEDLRAISKDKHLWISYQPEQIEQDRNAANHDQAAIDLEKRWDRFGNYGFEEIKILPGNIGYFKFNKFSRAQEGFQVAVGAMNFLANTDALIFDMRQNGGGNPEMIQLISSYLFGEETQHLNSFYFRNDDKTNQTWTLPYIPGKRLDKTDVYVLTSNSTFSGAEEFTYNLKNMKRATIIGETTGGGAHPVQGMTMNNNFIISVPYARAINPISKTNWEGTGVEPDIKTTADKAFESAYIMALKKLSDKEKDPKFKTRYEWIAEGQEAKQNPVSVNQIVLKSYAGKFGPRNIIFEGGSLYYQRDGRPKFKMIPLNEEYFGFEELTYFRLKIIKEGNKVVALEGHYDNGFNDRNEKTK